MAINRTGLPNPDDYNLGRGALFFALNDANGKPIEYRHLGNATAFNISSETETIQHQSSRSGIKVTDLEIVTGQQLTLSISLDEINFDNLALFFSGETADVNSTVPTQNAAKLGMTDVLQAAAANKGRWVDLTDSAGRRLYDIVAGNLTVKTESGGGGTAGSTLTPNSDYLIDDKMGRVFLLSTGSGHTNGKQLYASYTADATAKDIEQVRGFTKSQIVGALKFIAKNAVSGSKQKEYQFHSVTLRPEGDLSLIGDEYTEITLAGTVGKNEKFSPTSPVVNITTHADA